MTSLPPPTRNRPEYFDDQTWIIKDQRVSDNIDRKRGGSCRRNKGFQYSLSTQGCFLSRGVPIACDEVGATANQRLVGLRIELCYEFPPRGGLRGLLQHPVRLAWAGPPAIDAPIRIGSRRSNTQNLEGLAVHGSQVARLVDHQDRFVLRHFVEVVTIGMPLLFEL